MINVRKDFTKRHAICASVGGVGDMHVWVALVMCLCGWCASVGGMLAWVGCSHV